MRPLTSTISQRLAVLLLAFLFTVPAFAQTNINQLASLGVEIWPDYDDPSALVLLTAALPATTPLPATVTIPLPAGAEIHAVASFNQLGALMMDVDYSIENNRMTLTTPSNRFRVEYYAPYVADGNEFAYTFNWTSDLNIEQVTVVVQQPAAATAFSTEPAFVSSAAERGDGLTYHTLPSRSVGAGEPFNVRVQYTVDEPALSAPPQTAAPTTPGITTTAPPAGGFDPLYLLIGAGVLLLVGGAWYLGRQQAMSGGRARKPQPNRPPKSKRAAPPTARPKQAAAGARFCHSCGQRARPTDTFCRSCGTQLKSGE